MIPAVRAMQRVPMNRTEPGELATAGCQDMEDLLAECGRTNGVEQKLDFHPPARLLGESFREAAPHFSIPVDVLLHGDGVLGTFNRVEHRGIEFVSVVINRYTISGDERHSGNTFDGVLEFHRVHVEIRFEGKYSGMSFRGGVILKKGDRAERDGKPRVARPLSRDGDGEPGPPSPHYVTNPVREIDGAIALRFGARGG